MDAGRRIGDFATVERHAQVLLELDPLSEDAVRGVMEARAWVGDRSSALKAYGRLEARLAEELAAKPSGDLARVAGLLREGRRPAPRPAAPGEVPERQERRFEAETLIGREAEFAHLYDSWLEVRRRVPRIFVLIGDPGVGKTTLANAFVSTCQMEGAVVARAQASPEIFNAFPGVPKPVEWSAEVIPLRLADSFLKAAEAATEESPLVLVVDDIHAADNASAAILHVVARKLPRTRLLLIFTARSNELRTNAGPSALVSDATIEALQQLDLEPVAPPAAERLVEAVTARAKGRLADVPVARILQAGNGNPLALELLTREWLAHGSTSLLSELEALNTQPVAHLGIPRAIGAVFERQIRRLDAPTRAALDLAAVLGRRLADLPLYEVVDLTPAAAGEALSRLKEEGLLREVHGSLEFRNELIRAQAYYAVTGPARQHLHRRVGEVLAARTYEEAQAPMLEVAWHFLRGSDLVRAAAGALKGAEAAICVGAPFEAEQILTVLLREPCAQHEPQRLRLLLARALVSQSKATAAVPVLALLSQAADLSAHERADTARMEATVQYLLNDEPGPSYCDAADRALSASRKTADFELIGKALFECARSGVNAGDEARVAAAQRETDLAISKCGSEPLPILLYTRAYCDFFFYELAAAANELERALALVSERTDPVNLSLMYTGYGTSKAGLCEFEAACEAYGKALQLSRRIGDDLRSAIITSNLCVAKLHQGDFESAASLGELAVSRAARAPSPRLVTIYLNLAIAALLRGDSERARRSIEAAEASSERERSWAATMEFLVGSATVSLIMRDTALALDLIERAERRARGKERAVPNAGLFDELRIIKAGHVVGPILLECAGRSSVAREVLVGTPNARDQRRTAAF